MRTHITIALLLLGSARCAGCGTGGGGNGAAYIKPSVAGIIAGAGGSFQVGRRCRLVEVRQQ